MRRLTLLAVAALFALSTIACGGGGKKKEDGGVDGGPPEVIEDLPIAETVSMAALEAEVDVVVDDRGIPHIYAANAADAIRVQGFMMARDRMAQMEFLRRAIEGRLAEVAGNLVPSMVPADKSVRLLGFHRQAQAAYDALPADSDAKEALDAFADGVNTFLQQIRDGQASLPGDTLPGLLRPELLTDWTGVNCESLARYQTYSLSFSGYDDVDWGLGLVGVATAFPSDSLDPKLAARAGAFSDLWPMAPAEAAYTLEGFMDLDVRRARPVPPRDPAQPQRWLPNADLLRRARPFMQELKELQDRLAGGGSNNWIIAGEHTASGHAILANDPHLSLSSPGVWWLNHINTARAGGDWDTMGVSFAGLPGITLGFNRKVSWGATVNNYDVTDVYQEVITPGENGEPDTVLFNGEQVPIEKVTETIKVSGAPDIEYEMEFVPHHGPIIADTRTDNSALSMKWTGFTPSNEIQAFVGFGTAETVDDVATAMQHFEVGGQNIVSADSSGNIYWTTRVHVPVRDPRAMTWDPDTQTGLHPGLILPGTGEYEWIGRLAEEDIPQSKNPDSGWLATANQDSVGTNKDGNPINDEHYLTNNANMGHRQARILSLLEPMIAAGGITPEQMQQIQADHRSPQGAMLTGVIVAALDRAIEEYGTPGTHADLQALIAEASVEVATVTEMRDRLVNWTSYWTPAAVEGSPAADEIADSVAATLFNATVTRLVHFAFDDEVELIGVRPSGAHIARTLQFGLLAPDRLATYDDAIGDTVLWDDLGTVDVDETRDERIVRSALTALNWLEGEFGTADMELWRWGELHTIRFIDLFGLDAFGADIFSIPPRNDPDFPNGFPRHGDNHVVDASAYGNWDTNDFSYGHGPSQRLVVVMHPDGPEAYNALPGGQQHDPALPHHADEAELWRHNEAPRLAYEELEVVQAAEKRIKFTP